MALLHRATIRPTKAELLAWGVPTQPWGERELELVGAYRFDDPAGEVGIETHILSTADGNLLQVPLTYRGSALDGADQFLICTMEHSVLGQRWIYDVTGDPVYADVLASVLLADAVQADEIVEGADAPREPSVRVTASGSRSARRPAHHRRECVLRRLDDGHGGLPGRSPNRRLPSFRPARASRRTASPPSRARGRESRRRSCSPTSPETFALLGGLRPAERGHVHRRPVPLP